MDWTKGLSNRAADRLWQSIAAPIQNWFDQHPWLEWLLQHPLWLLGLLLLVIFLFAGLLQAIGRLTENIWLTLLRLPFQLVMWLLIGCVELGRFVFGKRRASTKAIAAAPETAPETKSENRLQELLDRLDKVRTEEEALLQEVKAILAAREAK